MQRRKYRSKRVMGLRETEFVDEVDAALGARPETAKQNTFSNISTRDLNRSRIRARDRTRSSDRPSNIQPLTFSSASIGGRYVSVRIMLAFKVRPFVHELLAALIVDDPRHGMGESDLIG